MEHSTVPHAASAVGLDHTSWRERIHSMISCSRYPTELAPIRIRLGNVGSNRGDFGFCISKNLDLLIPSVSIASLLRSTLLRCTFVVIALPRSNALFNELHFLQNCLRKRPHFLPYWFYFYDFSSRSCGPSLKCLPLQVASNFSFHHQHREPRYSTSHVLRGGI